MASISAKTIAKSIAKSAKYYLDKSTKTVREELDRKISVIDLSYDALNSSCMDGHLDPKDYAIIKNALLTIPTDSSVSSVEELVTKFVLLSWEGKTPSTTIISSGESLVLVAPSYGTAQNRISIALKKVDRTKVGNIAKDFLENDKGILQGNLGHIYNNELESLSSPLQVKNNSFLASLTGRLSQGKYSAVVSQADKLIEKTIAEHKLHLTYTYSTPSFAELDKTLGKFFVALTFQTGKRNNALSKIEGELGKEMVNFFTDSDNILQITEQHRSNSIKQDIAELVSAALQGRKPSIVSHTGDKITELIPMFDKFKLSTIKSTVKLSPLRTKKGQFTSLTSIKNMINLQLMEQVASNMGKGNAKSILNFRTGRFAASAHVEQLVRNKDQSLTAFYTYLKYPYATFQPDGRQGYPESRDPRLLISKSIRQLAAQQMSERLKTICV